MKFKSIIKNFIFFFFTLLFLYSCNQVGLFAGNLGKNIAQLPMDGLSRASNWISGETYDQYRDKTKKKIDGQSIGSSSFYRSDDYVSSTDQCMVEVKRTGDEQLDQLSRDLAGIESNFCKCEVWGNCSKASCPCEVLCPDDFRIFDITREQSSASEKNSLSFRNEKEAFESTNPMVNVGGYCWGHAAVTQRFNRLGMFNPDESPPYDKEEEPDKFFDYYKDVIDSVINNEATDIPGFSNLNEISSDEHPELQEYLAKRVSEVWAREAVRFQGLRVGASAWGMSESKNQSRLDDIKERIDMGLDPQIIFTARGAPYNTHAVLAHDYIMDSPRPGEISICIRDSNLKPEDNENCRNRISLNHDGELKYDYRKEVEINDQPRILFLQQDLGGLEVTHNQDPDSIEQMHSLRKYCQEERGCN